LRPPPTRPAGSINDSYAQPAWMRSGIPGG
jgi:hypothetical protein